MTTSPTPWRYRPTCSWRPFSIGLPSSARTMSPDCSPARAAGPPGTTSARTTPPSRGEAEAAASSRRDRLRAHADVAAAHAAVLADLLEDVADDVARRGEAEALVAAGLREDQRVDADEPALGVDQRPAAVARIDGRVGLDVDHRVVGLELPRHRADDAQRHRVVEARAGCRTPARSARAAASSESPKASAGSPLASTLSTARSVSSSIADDLRRHTRGRAPQNRPLPGTAMRRQLHRMPLRATTTCALVTM